MTKIFPSHLSALVQLLLILACLGSASGQALAATTPGQGDFTCTVDGVALRFTPSGVVLVDTRQALRIGFVDAEAVRPVGVAGPTEGGDANELKRAAYPGLWPGIDLVYEREPGGFVKSTLYADAGADLSRIGLEYNAPVAVADDGSLSIALPAGTLRESAPVAWQEKDGARLPVEVAFSPRGDKRIGFRVGAYDKTLPLVIDPSLAWNTFPGVRQGQACATDSSGNVYVVGTATATWGTPLHAYSGSPSNLFVAKFDKDGALKWNTFWGGSLSCDGYNIALDSDGNIYAVGVTTATFTGPAGEEPLHAYTGGRDCLVIKLNKDGGYVWHTIWGSSSDDYCNGLALDDAANLYAGGTSYYGWGPGNATCPGTGYSTSLMKFDKNGALHWNMFTSNNYYTSPQNQVGVSVDASSNVYAVSSGYDWTGPGTKAPLHAHSGGTYDITVLKSDASGNYQWHTFYGGSSSDWGQAVAVDSDGAVYAAGYSGATWDGPTGQAPLNAYAGSNDITLLKLDKDGAYQWHTFAGSSERDNGYGVAVDSDKNAYVTGYSRATWGTPLRAYAGGDDAVLAKFDSAGKLTWNAFFGCTGTDEGYGLALDPSTNVLATGTSGGTWGEPIIAHNGGTDIALFKYNDPKADPTPSTLSVSADPTDASTGVALDKVVKLTFSAAMKKSTVADKLAISPIANTDYALSWSSDNKTLSITVKSKWAASTKYTLTLQKTVNSTANAQLASTLTSTFTTKALSASEAEADAGGAPNRPQIEATLNQAGISVGQAAQMVSTDNIVLIPDSLGVAGEKGCALGTGTDKTKACDEAEAFAAQVPDGNKPSDFNAADTLASVKNLQGNATSSTSASPKIVTLYAQGYLPGGSTSFPQCFKARTDSYEILQFSYVEAMTAALIKAAADGDGIAGFSLINPSTGAVVQPQDSLPALAGGYTLVLYIKDNSRFDTDSAWGQVQDPSYLTSGQTGSASGSSSGCMANPTASMSLEWLLILLVPALGFLRSRPKQ